MTDKNFTIKTKRGVDVPVPEWLYNINNIDGAAVKLITYELAHILVPLNSVAQNKVLEAFRTVLCRMNVCRLRPRGRVVLR